MLDINEIINYLEKIKNKCDNKLTCDGCAFNNTDKCGIVKVIRKLNDELAVEPMWWNIKAIRNILEKEV